MSQPKAQSNGRGELGSKTHLMLLAALLLVALAAVALYPGAAARGKVNALPPVVNTSTAVQDDAPNFSPAPEPGLIAHWRFDEQDGNIARDSVEGLEGNVHGAKFEAGKEGNALLFDGVDDYVQLSQESFRRVSNLSQGTIAFWFKFESVLDRQSIMPMFYLGMAEDKNVDNILIIEVGHFKQGNLRTQDPDNKRLYSTFIKDSGHPFLCLDSGRSMEEGEWIHYALVSGANGTDVFINGEGIPANYNFGKLRDTYFLHDVPDTQVIMLGRGKTSSMATPDFVYYKGYLDELRIYDRPLSPDEVKQMATR